jgi:hypothetical protein
MFTLEVLLCCYPPLVQVDENFPELWLLRRLLHNDFNSCTACGSLPAMSQAVLPLEELNHEFLGRLLERDNPVVETIV